MDLPDTSPPGLPEKVDLKNLKSDLKQCLRQLRDRNPENYAVFVLCEPKKMALLDADVLIEGLQCVRQMRENLQALDTGPMTAEELRRMQRIGDFLHRK